MLKVEDLENYYRVTIDDRNLNYGNYFSSGDVLDYKVEEYNSHNTEQKDIEGIKELLLKLDFVKQAVKK